MGPVAPPLAPHAPAFPLDSQLATPFAPDSIEVVDLTRVISGPSGHDVHVPPPLASSLAKDRAARSEKRRLKKREAKLKNQKDGE